MENILYLKDEVYQVTGCAMAVLNTLGHGFAEKIYENAMVVELQAQGIPYKQQAQFDVVYKDVHVGTYIPDLIVYDQIVVEMKVIDCITDREKGQLLNYLKVTGFKVGLILNFRNAKLEWQRLVL